MSLDFSQHLLTQVPCKETDQTKPNSCPEPIQYMPIHDDHKKDVDELQTNSAWVIAIANITVFCNFLVLGLFLNAMLDSIPLCF